MNVVFSDSLALNTDRGKARPGDNQGRVSSIRFSYDETYSAPVTTLSVSGTHGQNQAIIDALVAQKLTDLRIEHIEPGDRTTDLHISSKQDPRRIVKALHEAALISQTDRWNADQLITRTETAVDMKRQIAGWRDQKPASGPSAKPVPPASTARRAS
ncbi:MAG: hypothetical protein CL558_04920 [Alphaproteobacteria bacterium]|nr:hypothetical protein [Alphaproteobacteria bacterium]MAS45931.1 hypothetical protein [Alphaproteobacteria bacterium]MAX95887.1 hypothetical protein [Alphaproteobacteria bacterium]MBN52904.1 hypothetical protein [Alphaproteobacteria bacterium]OUT42428.1 MAG: hypothetical protein CBB62_09165 [Micavibrio sp. TMED2]|tara:strand:- start:7563 stop:8033 length:471 start_codon:yes stop_codon:yes gene_type:complete